MRKFLIGLLAIVAMVLLVNNSSWAQFNLSSISGANDYYAGASPTVVNDYAAPVTINYPPTTGVSPATIPAGGSASVAYPGGFGALAPASKNWSMRCVQDPSTISVTENGNGTASISGVHSFFTGGGGSSRMYAPDGSLIGQNQSSYTVSVAGTYRLETRDGVSSNATDIVYIPVTIAPTVVNYTISISANPSAGGSVSGGGSYANGSTANLSASVNGGYQFDGWYEGATLVSSSASYNFSVSGNRTLEARFSLIQYTVTVNSGTGGGNFAAGATVNITAAAAPAGQQFKNWTTASAGVTFSNANNASTSFVMPANAVTVTANYEPVPATAPTITTSSLPNATQGTAYSATLAATGTTPITWVVASGSLPSGLLLNATGAISGTPTTTGTFTFTVQADNAAGNVTKTLQIVVQSQGTPPTPTHTLTVNGGSGSGTYAEGDVIPISANAAPTGKVFDKWTGDVSKIANVNEATTTFTMGNSSATITATYKDAPVTTTFTVTFNADGGTPAPASQTVTAGGKAVEPSAPAKTGFIFAGWYDGRTKWDFSLNAVTANVTLTAKWDIGTANEAVMKSEIAVYAAGGVLFIQSGGEPVQMVQVFNIYGQLITTVYGNGMNELHINGIPKGILIVRVNNETIKVVNG